MTETAAFAAVTREAVKAGGRFMTAREMKNAGEPWGVNRVQLYLRGRAGAAGEVSSTVATSLYGMFPAWLIDLTWQETTALPAAAATTAYATACWEWGRKRVASLAGSEDLAELAERIVDSADASALALFAAWRSWQRPEDPPARAAHAVALLRELRGGLHFCALRGRGLDVPAALIADPEAGPEQMRKTGWSDDDIAALGHRAAAIPDLATRWARAEHDTNAAMGQCCEVLSTTQREDMSRLLTAFEEVSRPPQVATTEQRPRR